MYKSFWCKQNLGVPENWKDDMVVLSILHYYLDNRFTCISKVRVILLWRILRKYFFQGLTYKHNLGIQYEIRKNKNTKLCFEQEKDLIFLSKLAWMTSFFIKDTSLASSPSSLNLHRTWQVLFSRSPSLPSRKAIDNNM